MATLTHKRIPLISVGFLFVFFLLLQIQGPLLIRSLYEKQSFSLLNQLAGAPGLDSLGFYQGIIEDKWLGPLKQLISGLAFAIFAFVYLPNAGTRIFILAVFCYFLITRPEVLLFPPYGDAIGGPFAEGIWLKRHSFDYAGLAREPSYVYGGPKVYLFTIFSSYLAAMMKVFSAPKVFLIVNHLLYFLMGAAVVAYFRKILAKVFPAGVAVLVPVLLLSLPLFQTQAEIINMEMPLVFFSTLAVYYLTEKKIWPACLFSILAAGVKGVGILICGSVFAVSLFLFLWGGPDTRLRGHVLAAGLTALGFIVLQVYAAFYVLNEGGSVPLTGFGRGWPSIRSFPVTYLYAGALIIFITQYFRQARSLSPAGFLRQNYVPFVMFICAGAWYGFFINHMAVSPRYQLLLMPFSLFCIFYAVHALLKFPSMIKKALWVSIAFSFLGSYGLLYKPQTGNNHVLMERSLEYRNDIKLYIQVAKELETKYSGMIIGAPFIMAQALALEELGYVQQGREVLLYGMICQYGGIKNFRGLKYVNIPRTIWVGLLSDLPDGMEYPFSSRDKVLGQIYQGNRRATFFMGGIAIEQMRLIMEALQRQDVFKPLDKM